MKFNEFSRLEPEDYGKLDELEVKFKTMDIAEQEMIYSEFPYKSKMSIMTGIAKVYPKMEKYVEEKGYDFRESIEIYDIPQKQIIYLMKKS